MMHEALVSYNLDSESINSDNGSVESCETNKTGNYAINESGDIAIIVRDRQAHLEAARPNVSKSKLFIS